MNIVGPPADPAIRYNAASCGFCPNNQRSDESGACVPCNLQNRERIVGNACVQCPSGQVADPSTHGCLPCSATQITAGNSCTQCPFPRHADRATNTCEACPPDFVSDLSLLQPGVVCGLPAENILFSPAPTGDLCPDEIWLEVANVDLLATSGATPSVLELQVYGFNFAVATCPSEVLSFFQTDERSEASGTSSTTRFFTRNGGACFNHEGGPCPGSCQFVYPVQTITSQEIETTGLTTLRVRLFDPRQDRPQRVDHHREL